MLSEKHPIIIHVCTRKESEKWLSYIAHRVTLEKAPCNISARLNSEEQPKLHASWIKLWSLKCPSLTPLCPSTLYFYEVFFKLPLHWSRGNMPWFLMLQIYLIYCISELSLALRKKKMCLYFCELPLSFIRISRLPSQLSTIHAAW